MGKNVIRKLLHTADLHLKRDKPETVSALDKILQKAKSEKIDILTLGGDIFDKPEDADELRIELREKFTGNPFEIIAIPGNHDIDAYNDDLDFGSDFNIITSKEPKSIEKENVVITAVPYHKSLSEELIRSLQNKLIQNKINILLIHCTLDIGFSSGDFGEEEEKNYCPISKATLADLGFDYILAGHFHKKADLIKIDDKTIFSYPGSPVSHSIKELGKRHAVILDLQKREIVKTPLESFYFDRKDETIIPGKEDNSYSNVEEWILERKDDNCKLEVNLNGFIDYSEKKFKEKIENLNIDSKVTFNHRYKSVTKVLRHPLFKRFKKKLSKRNIECQERIEIKVIDAMSRLLAKGELRE